jgi:hypothetical protein
MLGRVSTERLEGARDGVQTPTFRKVGIGKDAELFLSSPFLDIFRLLGHRDFSQRRGQRVG